MPNWKHLESRPRSWRKQPFIKGTKVPVSVVWGALLSDNLTPEEIAQDRYLNVDAVIEAIAFVALNPNVLADDDATERLMLGAS